MPMTCYYCFHLKINFYSSYSIFLNLWLESSDNITADESADTTVNNFSTQLQAVTTQIT